MPRPAALLLAAAVALALAPAALARAALGFSDLPIGAIAGAYEIGLGTACGGVLFPPSAELEAASRECWGTIDAAADAPPTACPSECRAFAEGMGRHCWSGFHLATNALRASLAAAHEGGKELPSAEIAKLQNVSDFLTAKDPVANPRVDLAAELEAGNATDAAALRKEAAYASALEVTCKPEHKPPAAPAPAPAAPAAAVGAPTYVEELAAIYQDDLPSCKGVLFPASAEFKAAQRKCAGGAWWEAPTECPSKGLVCAASAPLWGADCLAEYNQNLARVLAAVSAALVGGPALPAADVAKFQAWRDLLTRVYPTIYPPVDVAKFVERGDAVYAAVLETRVKTYNALATACAASAGAGPAPAPATAEAVSGAAAPAAAAAAVLLAALLV
jgi:hypothetical protein